MTTSQWTPIQVGGRTIGWVFPSACRRFKGQHAEHWQWRTASDYATPFGNHTFEAAVSALRKATGHPETDDQKEG